MFEKKSFQTKTIAADELNGLMVEVKKSKDKNKIGIKGKIIKETKNTIRIETKKGEKIIPKKEVELKIKVGKKWIKVRGEDLIGRPEERIKIFWKKHRKALC